MKTTIFYLSGTGNSLKVARNLAEKLGESEIIPIAKIIDGEIDLPSERIGIVFPVYIWGMPLIVRRFVEKIGKNSEKYFFAVATCGGASANTLKQMENLFKKQGNRLSSGFVVYMPSNYIPWGSVLAENEQKKMFDKCNEKLKEIVDTVSKRESNKIEVGSLLSRVVLSGFVNRISSPQIPNMDKAFWATENCNGCGICSKVCPAKNIKLDTGRPEWLHRCEQCFSCLQWCPKESIQYGKKTIEKKRYRHPEIKLKDVILWD